MTLTSPAKSELTPEERTAAATALGSIMTPKKLAAIRKNALLGAEKGGRPTKPLSAIACSCGAGDVLEGHKWDCPRAQAIKRRIKRGMEIKF